MRALITAAHPDDVEFVCGGTVAALSSAGHQVSIAVVTSGTAGVSTDAGDDGVRESEQRASAAVLGVHDVRFLGFPDGAVTVEPRLRQELARVLRQVRPELVITHTPLRNLRSVRSSHPDHLAVGEATMCAVYPDGRNAFAFPELLAEGLVPHTVGEVWIHGTERADHVVDITEHFDRKLAAIGCHKSQADTHGNDQASFFRDWATQTAAQHGLLPGRLAEDYLKVDTW